MKKQIKVVCSSMIFLLPLCLALWSCGGGGSSGGAFQSDTALTETNAPQAAAGLFKATDIIGPLQGISGTLAVSSATASAANLQKPISNLLNITVNAAKNQKLASPQSSPSVIVPIPYTINCPDGGSLTLRNATWDGPAEPTSLDQIENFSGSVSFDNCKKGTLSLDGSTSISLAGPASAPTSATITATLTYSDSGADTTLSLSNLNVQVSNIGPGIAFKNATIKMSGALQGVLGEESVDIQCDNFIVQFAAFSEPAGVMAASATVPMVTGENVTLSGRIKTSCLNTWLTITTATPIKFIKGQICPSAGDVSLTSQSNTIRFVIADTFAISLYFNDELIATYMDCTDIKGHCSATN